MSYQDNDAAVILRLKFSVKSMDSEQLAVRAAWYYYKANMTQEAIAKKLSLSRMKVVRLLEKAKQDGIVSVHVKSAIYNCLQIEQELISTFHLDDAMVAPFDHMHDVNQIVAQAAAQYLELRLKTNDLLGIGWGDTISRMAGHFNLPDDRQIKIVTLSGGILSHDIGGRLSTVFKGRLYTINAPIMASSVELCDALKQEPVIKDALEMAKLADYSILGLGIPDRNATIVKAGYLSDVDLQIISSQGAVGDLLGQFFDEHGKKLDIPFHKRLINLDIEHLRSMNNVIVAAGGAHKVKAILAALKHRYCHTLITDEVTAGKLLSQVEE
ncbi:aminotransferase [candidate division KSB3 bacterium]|uniref:Aminotransferase n=1 Tax=candidate division KSB3 bacterium TaxID=2044937 RepID=A0A2G6E2X6_9BACT|nr:MAG: aminotransferase [candidate division KSB3 bacterium]